MLQQVRVNGLALPAIQGFMDETRHQRYLPGPRFAERRARRGEPIAKAAARQLGLVGLQRGQKVPAAEHGHVQVEQDNLGQFMLLGQGLCT